MKHRKPSEAGRRASELRHLGVRPSKQRGQNFVIDNSVIETIVEFGQPKPEERIVEVGPGLGALTAGLLQRAGKLTAIDIEERFCQEIARKFPDVTVLQGDARTFPLDTLGSDLTVFGNLPYVFSTDIIFHLVEHRASVRRAVLLLQKEFAERLAAGPGGRDYGSISVACRMFADVSLGPIIPGTSFHPPTKVQSRVIELRFLKESRVPVPDSGWFRKVVQGAFLQRRKKLTNSLMASGMFAKESVIKALEAASIDGNRRAETLSLDEFVILSKELGKLRL